MGYSVVGKKLLKMKPADLGRLDIEDSTKLVGTVALALWTQDTLVKQRIIPANIIMRRGAADNHRQQGKPFGRYICQTV